MYSYGLLHMAEQKQDDQLEHTLCEDTGCSPEDVPEAMNDREKWRERVREIRDVTVLVCLCYSQYF